MKTFLAVELLVGASIAANGPCEDFTLVLGGDWQRR